MLLCVGESCLSLRWSLVLADPSIKKVWTVEHWCGPYNASVTRQLVYNLLCVDSEEAWKAEISK